MFGAGAIGLAAARLLRRRRRKDGK
ncbi:MAG: hypothetical protein U5J78_03610 [Parasphingorhabdus sp.]|nr:hypothetical protein [Parasphingorhabdus sp.]